MMWLDLQGLNEPCTFGLPRLPDATWFCLLLIPSLFVILQSTTTTNRLGRTRADDTVNYPKRIIRPILIENLSPESLRYKYSIERENQIARRVEYNTFPMSTVKYGHSTLSGLIDSDSDDLLFENAGLPTPESGAENKTAGKKGRGRPKGGMPAKVTKAKATARRTSGRLNAKLKDVAPANGASKEIAEIKGKRKALSDKTNQQYGSDTEEVDEFEQNEDTVMEDELDAIVVAVKESKPKVAKKSVPARGEAKKKVVAKADQDIASDAQVLDSRTIEKKESAKRHLAPESPLEKIILESQVPATETHDPSNEEVIEETISRTAHNVRRPRSISRARQPSGYRMRAGSASDTERTDPALRRKLGDITKKYENLNIKYQGLREIGLKEAERNFERLKKQSEDKTAGKHT